MKRLCKQIAILVMIITLCFETLPVSLTKNLVLGAAKNQEYTDAELQRAVSLGIGGYAKNVQISHDQFFKMLDQVVKLAAPHKLETWQSNIRKPENQNVK